VSELVVPLDDAALDSIEHALGAVYTIDEGGEHQIQGADYNLSQLLDFWSGFDHTKGVHDGYIGEIPVYVFDTPSLTEKDVIRALVAEVRRLRGAS
jgi:hypothetical protein